MDFTNYDPQNYQNPATPQQVFAELIPFFSNRAEVCRQLEINPTNLARFKSDRPKTQRIMPRAVRQRLVKLTGYKVPETWLISGRPPADKRCRACFQYVPG